MKINSRGVLTFVAIFIIIISAGSGGSLEGAEDYIWSTVIAAIAIALGMAYLANQTKVEKNDIKE